MSVPSGTYSNLDEDQLVSILEHPLFNQQFKETARLRLEEIKGGYSPTLAQNKTLEISGGVVNQVLSEMEKNFPLGLNLQQQDKLKKTMKSFLEYLKYNNIKITNEEIDTLIRSPVFPEYKHDLRLRNLEKEENIKRELYREKKKITNMTINEIFIEVSQNIIQTIEDLFNKPSGISVFQHMIDVLTKDDRPIYFGIILIVFSIFIGIFVAK